MQQATKCFCCDSLNNSGQEFCGSCGARLLPVCPNCGSSRDPAARFCSNCSSQMNGEMQKPTEWIKEKVSKAEILEEMCHHGHHLHGGLMRKLILEGKDLTEGERTILRRKNLSELGGFGRVAFPISGTEREGFGEQIVQFYDEHPFEPLSLLAEAATPIDVLTMERLLRKVYKESYGTEFELARLRIIDMKEAPNTMPKLTR